MTPVEIMALCLALLVVIKFSVIAYNPNRWFHFAQKVYSNSAALTIASLFLAALTGYYLLQELTIVQVFAAILF